MTSRKPKSPRDAVRLYTANLSLLATHQVDAAFWHEWDVFGVPGGLPMFLVFNVAAVALLAMGLVRVAEGARSSRRYVLSCASVGLFTVGLHAIFLALDRNAFWSTSSVVILLGVLATSIVQLFRASSTTAPSALMRVSP